MECNARFTIATNKLIHFRTLIDRLEWCGLHVHYWDVFISCVDSLVSKWYNAKFLQISSANCCFWVNYYFNIGKGNLLPAPGFLHFLQLSLLLKDVSGQVAVTGDAFHLWMVLKLLDQLLVVVCGSFFSGRELWTMRFVSLVKIAYIQSIHLTTAMGTTCFQTALMYTFLMNALHKHNSVSCTDMQHPEKLT